METKNIFKGFECNFFWKNVGKCLILVFLIFGVILYLTIEVSALNGWTCCECNDGSWHAWELFEGCDGDDGACASHGGWTDRTYQLRSDLDVKYYTCGGDCSNEDSTCYSDGQWLCDTAGLNDQEDECKQSGLFLCKPFRDWPACGAKGNCVCDNWGTFLHPFKANADKNCSCGGTPPIPEFSTVVLLLLSLFIMGGYVKLRRRRNN